MSEPVLYQDLDLKDHDNGYHPYLSNEDGSGRCLQCEAVLRWVVPVEPDHTVLMCEYCLCYIDKSQADEACWNCGAYRVQGFALFVLGEGIGGDDD